MTGLELLTAAHNKLPVMILVLRDRELAQISQFQQTAMATKFAVNCPITICRQSAGAWKFSISRCAITLKSKPC